MPAPRKLSALRRLFKQLILCLIFAAILQYAVAAAFSLRGSYGNRRHSWSLDVSEGALYAAVYVYEHPTFGRDVLTGSFQFATDRHRAPIPDTMPDWSRGEWLNEVQTANRLIDPSEKMPPPEPPAWSRFSTLQTDPNFDYYPSRAQPAFLEVATGWPRRSASYFAHYAEGGGIYKVRDGLALADTVRAINVTPRVIPLAIYWPGAIINTLVYAAALFLPFTLIPMMRRHLRCRAGRCPNCNYDLRGAPHTVCPECGAAIAPLARSLVNQRIPP